MEGRVPVFAAYLRQSWPLFVIGLVIGLGIGVWL